MRRMNWISLLLTGALLTVPFGMGAQAADAAGDVNADGASDAEDVALLQNWLLGQEVTLPDGQAGDLSHGEGVYIGSTYSTSGFDYKCDYNRVDG